MARSGRSRASEDLLDQERNSLDEARMVLPGIQAVFGFQLIAVFNDRFAQLPEVLRIAHFASLSLVVVAVALIMTPAAYDRLAEPDVVTRRFLANTATLLTTAMGVFGCAIASEMFVVAAMVTQSITLGVAASLVALALFGTLWFVFPLRRAREEAARRKAAGSSRAPS